MKRRTRARELALQFLYQLDLLGPATLDELDEFLRGEERDRTTVDFADHLVRGTLASRDSLDEVIRGVAQNWDIGRMAVIDRNVLRMATFELLHCADIPPKVSINEAIELGKRFSTQNSGGFINGILDKIKDRELAGSPSGDEAELETETQAQELHSAELGSATEVLPSNAPQPVAIDVPAPTALDPSALDEEPQDEENGAEVGVSES